MNAVTDWVHDSFSVGRAAGHRAGVLRPAVTD
jgi:hypothetical protein